MMDVIYKDMDEVTRDFAIEDVVFMVNSYLSKYVQRERRRNGIFPPASPAHRCAEIAEHYVQEEIRRRR